MNPLIEALRPDVLAFVHEYLAGKRGLSPTELLAIIDSRIGKVLTAAEEHAMLIECVGAYIKARDNDADPGERMRLSYQMSDAYKRMRAAVRDGQGRVG